MPFGRILDLELIQSFQCRGYLSQGGGHGAELGSGAGAVLDGFDRNNDDIDAIDYIADGPPKSSWYHFETPNRGLGRLSADAPGPRSKRSRRRSR
jgi:hypothetical protein